MSRGQHHDQQLDSDGIIAVQHDRQGHGRIVGQHFGHRRRLGRHLRCGLCGQHGRQLRRRNWWFPDLRLQRAWASICRATTPAPSTSSRTTASSRRFPASPSSPRRSASMARARSTTTASVTGDVVLVDSGGDPAHLQQPRRRAVQLRDPGGRRPRHQRRHHRAGRHAALSCRPCRRSSAATSSQNAGGIYAVDLDPAASSFRNDFIVVDGNAQLAGNVAVRLLSLPVTAVDSFIILRPARWTPTGSALIASPALHATLLARCQRPSSSALPSTSPSMASTPTSAPSRTTSTRSSRRRRHARAGPARAAQRRQPRRVTKPRSTSCRRSSIPTRRSPRSTRASPSPTAC